VSIFTPGTGSFVWFSNPSCPSLPAPIEKNQYRGLTLPGFCLSWLYGDCANGKCRWILGNALEVEANAVNALEVEVNTVNALEVKVNTLNALEVEVNTVNALEVEVNTVNPLEVEVNTINDLPVMKGERMYVGKGTGMHFCPSGLV
jgi:hypothetical protein